MCKNCNRADYYHRIGLKASRIGEEDEVEIHLPEFAPHTRPHLVAGQEHKNGSQADSLTIPGQTNYPSLIDKQI